MKKASKKSTIAIYVVLQLSVILTMIAQFIHKNYDNVFLCVLTLILFLIPSFVNRNFNIQLPSTLEVIILLFIYAAEILGEIQGYYINFKHWDTMLHTINGFLMAAIGFSLVDVINSNEKIRFNMSPVFVASVALCFSMTIGIIWEFFEFSMDTFFFNDMQKDSLTQSISTVYLNPERKNQCFRITDITKTVIMGKVDGKKTEVVINNGYMDIGLKDTMKDLIVNFIGAIIFSIFGFLYIKNRGKGNFLKAFIFTRNENSETEENEK